MRAPILLGNTAKKRTQRLSNRKHFSKNEKTLSKDFKQDEQKFFFLKYV